MVCLHLGFPHFGDQLLDLDADSYYLFAERNSAQVDICHLQLPLFGMYPSQDANAYKARERRTLQNRRRGSARICSSWIMVLSHFLLWCHKADWTLCDHDLRYGDG